VGKGKLHVNRHSPVSSSPLRRAVWKIPFRLDEIPFFDTSFLCEPAQPTHFTSYEEEIEPWDAPLRRRNNVSSQITNQMYSHGNRRESHYSEIGSDDGMVCSNRNSLNEDLLTCN
jgi:myosin III